MIPFRELKDKEDAVSAVIGVILMVAITVAIAATVYVYVSGMIGTSPQSAPNVQFVKDDVNDKLTVASAEPGNLNWGDLNITVIVTNLASSNNYINATLYAGGQASSYTNVTGSNTGYISGSSSSTVNAGDYIKITQGSSNTDNDYTVTIQIRHTDTNTLLGTWDFH